MEQPRPKKSKLGWILALVALLGVGAGVGIALFLHSAGGLFAPEEPPAPFFASGPVRAVRLEVPDKNTMSEEDWRDYFADAAQQAAENGVNTLLFEAKKGLEVYWRDEVFSPPASILEQDSLFSKTDPLALLCAAASEKGLQVWLVVEPYTAGNYSDELRGAAAELAAQRGGAQLAAFEAGDAEYAVLLTQSLSALPQKYPIAGIVLEDAGAAQGEDLSGLVRTVGGALDAAGHRTRLGLFLDADRTKITPEMAGDLAKGGHLDYLLPAVAGGDGLRDRLRAWSVPGSSFVAVQPLEADGGSYLFAACIVENFSGALLGEAGAVYGDPAELALRYTGMEQVEGTLPLGFAVPHTLAVNYPLEGDEIAERQQSVYVMGSSDPEKPLLLNGEEVFRGGGEGTFGVLVELEPGENSFEFSNGDATLTHLITRPVPEEETEEQEPSEGEEETPEGEQAEPEETEEETEPEPEEKEAATPSDATREAPEGQAVRVVTTFAGALLRPGYDNEISETLYEGATVVVRDSARTVRYDADLGRNVMTWAYQLANGSWVGAANCTWAEGDGLSAFTGLSAGAATGGEWLAFEGAGAPAVWMNKTGDVLSVTMYDTSFSLPGGFTSALVEEAWVEEMEDGVVLHLRGADIWGYQIDYTGGATRLFLKAKPALSDQPGKPLAGVRILLDPGHGDWDVGAPGIMGPVGPNEKDVNLAQSQAIAYRLRQLGAEVVMTREGEEFYTVAERLAMLIETKPDFFISVHHNSADMWGDRNLASGLQVYYYIGQDNSAPISKVFGQQLMDPAAQRSGRGASTSAWGYYTVLRSPVCPAVLFEYGFMVNPAEFEDIISTDGLYAAAEGTVQGIMNTLEL